MDSIFRRAARRPPAVATMVAPPGWRRSSIVPAPATPGQGGLTRVLRDRLSAMRADLTLLRATVAACRVSAGNPAQSGR